MTAHVIFLNYLKKGKFQMGPIMPSLCSLKQTYTIDAYLSNAVQIGPYSVAYERRKLKCYRIFDLRNVAAPEVERRCTTTNLPIQRYQNHFYKLPRFFAYCTKWLGQPLPFKSVTNRQTDKTLNIFGSPDCVRSRSRGRQTLHSYTVDDFCTFAAFTVNQNFW